jgi:lysophospholipase L1-like esterase
LKLSYHPVVRCLTLLLVVAGAATGAIAQDSPPILGDLDGNGSVNILCVGDSLTFGVGDGGLSSQDRPAGYPSRLSSLLQVPVRNAGIPGEEFVAAGVFRYPDVLSGDFSLILEGSNDAVKQVNTGLYARAVQRAINVSLARGVQPVLATIPPPCCEHAALAPYTESYSMSIRELGAVNALAVADLERAWKSTCVDKTECELYNLPEGLHPTARGYTVMAQSFAATLLGIDLFNANGPANLAAALGIDPSAVIVKPDQRLPSEGEAP